MNSDMLSFSQRMGLSPLKDMQINEMDRDLRISIWNFLYDFFYNNVLEKDLLLYEETQDYIWRRHFIMPADENNMDMFTKGYLKKHILNTDWYCVYDLLQLIAFYLKEAEPRYFFNVFSAYSLYLNGVLEREKAAYRLIDNEIVPITDKQEINELEEAFEQTKDRFKNVHKHLSTALHLMSDRSKPDYRNSIKESISAVEAISRIICDDPKPTLNNALIRLSKTIDLHGALKDGFIKLYGYTSDDTGIRHALMDEDNLEYEDAKYMLVSCTSFINYLIIKADKAGVIGTAKEGNNE